MSEGVDLTQHDLHIGTGAAGLTYAPAQRGLSVGEGNPLSLPAPFGSAVTLVPPELGGTRRPGVGPATAHRRDTGHTPRSRSDERILHELSSALEAPHVGLDPHRRFGCPGPEAPVAQHGLRRPSRGLRPIPGIAHVRRVR